MLKKFLANASVVALVATGLGVAAVNSAQAETADLAIIRVNYNALGADTMANRWQEAVYLRARTDLAEPLDIGGWKVHDGYKNAEGEYSNSFTFPAGTKVRPDGLVVVSPAYGENKTDQAKTQAFYMDFRKGYNGHFINNSGDKVVVEKAGGGIVASFEFDFDNGYYIR